MKTVTSFALNLAAAVLIVVASATIAAAGTDTCAGEGATLDATCTPLTNTTSGSNDNSGFGYSALFHNTTGEENTAAGADALNGNTTGGANTAAGGDALGNNTTGGENTAAGAGALFSNTIGGDNTATGEGALFSNTTADDNTAMGASALGHSKGSFNIGIGSGAGLNLTTGDNNIDIFDPGVAGESNTIRIGTQGTQTDTFIAGIYQEKVGKKHCSVLVDSDGRVGCGSSKEVDASMLLNEVQKQAKENKQKDVRIAALQRQIVSQQQQISALQRKDAQIDALAERMNALERQAQLSWPEHLASAIR
jgi:hypothetical protein